MEPRRPHRTTQRILAPAIAVAVGILTGAPVRAQAPEASPTPRIGVERIAEPDLVERLDAEGAARVVIVLVGPRDRALRSAALVASELGEAELRGRRTFQRIPALTGELTPAGLARLADDPRVLRVSLDTPIRVQLDEARPLVGADLLHAQNATGASTVAALIDSGVDLDHADLIGSVTDEACFCLGVSGSAGCCPNGLETQTGPGAGQDDNGHGTQVAGVVTSAGVHAGLGIAPAATLIVVKVVNAAGGGDASDLLLGLDWILVHHPEVDVVNLSLGGGLYDGDCDDADATTMAYADAIGQLRDAGALTIAGSGNDGSGAGMIAPACVADAISVGAVWDDDLGSQTAHGCTDPTTAADQVTCWSNSSATTDVFAPGGVMLSSRLDGTVKAGSGTSYATPVVSGCALLLRGAFPMLAPGVVEQAVTTSSVSVTDAKNGLVFPRVRCDAAFEALSPGVPALGRGGSIPLGWTALAACLAITGLGRLGRRWMWGGPQRRS